MERDKQGIVLQEQAKLREIEVYVLHVVHTAQAIDIGIIGTIAVFQQQEILYKQGIFCFIVGLRGVVVAGIRCFALPSTWSQIFVDIEIQATNSIHFGDGAI